MIRPFTLICLAMACGSGLYLYQCKHQARELDREIARTIKQTEEVRSRIGMLRAEWTQLNEPERVATLAREHTTLQPAKPEQFTTVAQLPSRLPPIAPPTVPEREPSEPPAPAPVPTATLSGLIGTAHAEPMPAPAAVPPQTATSAPNASTKPPVRPAAPIVAAATPPAGPPSAPASPSPSTPVAERPAKPAETPRATARAVEPSRPQSAAPRRHEPEQYAAVPRSERQVSTDATAPGTVGAAVLRAMRSREEPAFAGQPVMQPLMQPVSTPRPAPAFVPSYAPAPPPAYTPPASVLGGSRGSLPPPVPFAER